MQLPIGVFDSGVGGLTVLKALLDAFPNESFLYLGDTARLPYGTKSPESIRKYSEQALRFLCQQKVKAIVIACNSASSQFRENHFKTEFGDVPVINVIEPGAKAALQISAHGRIGILATQATVSSGVYEKTLLDMARVQNKTISVFSSTAPLFVPLAEEAWIDDPITNLVAYRYLQPLTHHQIDTLILGCTHYPILRNSIARAVGAAVNLVESGAAVALELKARMLADKIQSKESTLARTLQLISTDDSPTFRKLSVQLLAPHALHSFSVADI